jgi:hypothetical protein
MARCTVRAVHPRGFEVTVLVSDIEAVDAAIEVLLAKGYRSTGSGDGYQRTPTGEPLCPRHQVVMVKRSRFNGEWYSHKTQDPRTGQVRWCRGYATGKPDDGYALG